MISFKHFTIIIISFFLNIQLQAMNQSLSRINRAQFQEIAEYSQRFLMTYINKLACEKNESGFVRMSVPITDELMTPSFKNIKKIRVNYWTPEAGVVLNPESIHTHPHYFESFIIKGGYRDEGFIYF